MRHQQRCLGNYALLECLGKAGHVSVFVAKHRFLAQNRKFVLKVQDLARAGSVEKERFLREAQFASKLRHPHIVPVFDLQEIESYRVLVMEYVEGTTLDTFLRDRETLSLPQICNLGIQIASAMDTVHRHGIVHRDLKPDNILVTVIRDQCSVRIIDFGLAFCTANTRVTPRSKLCGTPAYVAPELCCGMEPTSLCDVYSLGVVLYEMISGRVPFEGDTVANVLLRQIHAQPPPLPRRFPRRLQSELETLVYSMLSKKPQHRPPGMRHVRAMLEQLKQKASGRNTLTSLRSPLKNAPDTSEQPAFGTVVKAEDMQKLHNQLDHLAKENRMLRAALRNHGIQLETLGKDEKNA